MQGLIRWGVTNWVLFFAVTILLSVLSSVTTQAFSWQSDSLELSSEDVPSEWDPKCTTKNVRIGSALSVTNADICVYEGKDFRFGYYTKPHQYWYMPSTTNMVVSFGSDEAMYIVENLGRETSWELIPGTNDIIVNRLTTGFTNNHHLTVIRNFPVYLTKNAGLFNSDQYTFDWPAVQRAIFAKNSLTDPAITGAYEISNNGRWVAGEVMGVGLALFDNETQDIRWFSSYRHSYGYGSNAHIDFDISDDGKYVATFDYNIEPRIYSLSDECVITTQKVDDSLAADLQHKTLCPYRSLTDVYMKQFDYQRTRSFNNPSFNFDGSALTVETWSEASDPEDWENFMIKKVTAYADGYNDQRLEYLALGDSYSSGEGDTEENFLGEKYYRDYTDNEEDKDNNQPLEKCHISTRSYPYLLANEMNLGQPLNEQATGWQTVACSGATTWDMKEAGAWYYNGQGERIKEYDSEALKTQALNEFIPGRQKQIEFVKKYQPKVITLTAGGNDVDFGGKIKKCAMMPDTCNYAEDDFKPRLKREILDQFDNLKNFYTELAVASHNKAKIFVVGYPQFISDASDAPCKNTFNLNYQERQMIVPSVEYLNNVIEAAAKKAGVVYVDIEGSLADEKLCEGTQQNVTAITNIFGLNSNELSESFHPNANGHSSIAQFIQQNYGYLNSAEVCYTGTFVCPDSTVDKSSIPAPYQHQLILMPKLATRSSSNKQLQMTH